MEHRYRYTLGDEQLDDGFKLAKRFVFRNRRKSDDRRVLALVGAQPAAGKTQAANALNDRHPDLVPVIGDDLRRFHPDYTKVMDENRLLMPDVTAKSSGQWVGKSLEHARKEGYSVLLEGTFRNTEMVLKNAEAFANNKGAPYKVEVSALAVNADRSLLDSVSRYLYSSEGRWTSSAAHDEAYERVPETVKALEESKNISRVVVTDRSGKDLYVNQRDPDGSLSRSPRASEFLEKHRSRPLGQQESRKWIANYWKYSREIVRRGELNSVTAPTFLRLHESADRIFQQAYPGDQEKLKVHQAHQALQKTVLHAGGNGANNSNLPQHPREYFAASDAKKAGFHAEFKKAKRASELKAKSGSGSRRFPWPTSGSPKNPVVGNDGPTR